MSVLALCLTALALAQAEPTPDAGEKATEVAPAVREVEPPQKPAAADLPAARPAPEPAAPRQAPPTPPAPAAAPAPTVAPAPTAVPPPTTPPPRRRAAPPPAPSPAQATAPAPTLAPSPPPEAAPATGRTAAGPTAPEREQVGRAARAFLEALAAGDAKALTDESSERFSFDGETQSGRDAVGRTWRAVLAGRPGPAPRVNGVEVLSAAEAIARHGKPPARVAALLRPGVWIAIGDVGGRPVVLFLAREGARFAVLGLHD